ncbi:MAG: hypothetical protein ABI690_16235 [Chloroflexota bacterium]
MSLNSKLHVAIVGLNFGADFVPLYAEHPDVEKVTNLLKKVDLRVQNEQMC